MELPSIVVMTLHKGVMIARGRGSTDAPLPIWVYRVLGFLLLCTGVLFVAAIAGAGSS